MKPKPILLLLRQGPQKRSSAGAAGAIARQNTTTEDVEHVAGALWISAAARPAFAASPTLCASAMNLLVETFEDHTGFRLVYTPPTENASDDGLNFTVNWIPEGYELESHRENRFSARCVYSSDNCQELSIGLFEGENTGLCLDTENAEVHDEMINGKKAVIITKEEVSQLCLIDEKKGNYLLITGSMEQTDDLVKIAQNIQFE